MNTPDPSVSPGIGGFLAFFLLGCALWLLMRNMIVRLRNVDRRAALEDEPVDAAGERAADEPPMTTRPTSAAGRRPGSGNGAADDPGGDADPADPAGAPEDPRDAERGGSTSS